MIRRLKNGGASGMLNSVGGSELISMPEVISTQITLDHNVEQ